MGSQSRRNFTQNPGEILLMSKWMMISPAAPREREMITINKYQTMKIYLVQG
jgi:hypothetical protein